MEFTSILDLRPCDKEAAPGRTFLVDLNIDQIIDQIGRDWKEKVDTYYCYFPQDVECEAYRRAVYADINCEKTYLILMDFIAKMAEWREARALKEEVESELQKSAWHIRETGCYCDAIEGLYAAMKPLALASAGMRSFRGYLESYLESDAYISMRDEMESLRREMSDFRFFLTYDKEHIVISENAAGDADAVSYETFLNRRYPGAGKPLKNPFTTTSELNDLEEEIMRVFRRKHAPFFKRAAAFYGTYGIYAQECLLRFRSEVQFYLSFYHFERKMKANGFSFAVPSVSEEAEMSAQGLYDLALACVNVREHREVVSNDMVFCEGESCFVLTGPNQGGKTTFARSLGQLVYFTKMGLDVPADAANVPYFNGILTHFSVEESVESGRGKLKEELVRLKPMMDEKHQGAFVVINELFTTAANYDACIMGKKVLEHFIEQGCRGIYVTHLKELAEAHPRVVSIKAAQDEQMRRNFKIVRSPAESIAYAMDQVNKYQLTYEQMKERLASLKNGESE